MNILDFVVLTTFGAGLIWVILDDESESIRKYIERHPKEFKR